MTFSPSTQGDICLETRQTGIATMTMRGSRTGFEMPSALEPPPMEVDAPSTAATGAGTTSAPTEDNFYNAAGKAPHLDSIVPK